MLYFMLGAIALSVILFVVLAGESEREDKRGNYGNSAYIGLASLFCLFMAGMGCIGILAKTFEWWGNSW